jgi:MFS family permease
MADLSPEQFHSEPASVIDPAGLHPTGQAPTAITREPPARGVPTGVRHGVLGFLCALAFVLYIDRICISQAAGSMQTDLGLSNTQMGFVFGAFTLAYALFEVPTGHWGDRYGSRKVLLRIVLWWSAFTALTGCVVKFHLDTGWIVPGVGWPVVLDSFLLLLLIRFLFGAGEAGALPNAARVLARWYPAGGRGPAQGLINTAASLGGATAPIVAAYLIHEIGWRYSFVVFGSLGIVWAIAFALWFRDDPARHPGVNAAELDLIRGSSGPEQPHLQLHPPVPWGRVLSSPNVWLLGLIMSCMCSVTYMFFSWYPKYLQSARDVPAVASGWLAGLVLAGAATGSTLGGFLADALARRWGERRWSTRVQGVGGLLLAAFGMVGSIYCDEALAAAGLTALAALGVGITVAAWWAVVTEISGPHLGALFGLMNSMGIVGAVFSQLFWGWFTDYRRGLGYLGRAQWDPAFWLYAGILLLGMVAWMLVDAHRSAVGDQAVGRVGNPSD